MRVSSASAQAMRYASPSLGLSVAHFGFGSSESLIVSCRGRPWSRLLERGRSHGFGKIGPMAGLVAQGCKVSLRFIVLGATYRRARHPLGPHQDQNRG